MTDLTPKQIVKELDRHIIGQGNAKKAVAVALRNRWRRMQLADDLIEEVLPKNILMIGPTGVGKTEIARRLAKLAKAPFTKVEATKFTEIGYVGRDVEQIIRDLVDVSIHQQREIMRESVKEQAVVAAEEKVLDVLVGESASPDTRQKFRRMLHANELQDKMIDIEVKENSSSNMNTFDIPGMPGAQMGMINIGEMLGKSFAPKNKKIHVNVAEALEILRQEEADNLIDDDKIIKNAISAVEQNGIVFLDEIDKICTRSENRGEVSREGVQRDLLPLIEGTTVSTKHGPVRTEHVLFITSGAFHVAKPSDLLPELQGRLPIRVELQPLTKEDFVKILKEPEANLIRQSTELLKTERVTISFEDPAIEKIAELAENINKNVENIGARRLHTLIEKLLEDISFNAPDLKKKNIIIDEKLVISTLSELVKDEDLSRFIL